MTAPKTDWHELEPEPRPSLHAALYARHLRENEHLSVAEAARRVMARYPHTRPLLSGLVKNRIPSGDA